MQNNPIEKMTYEMTDAELLQHEADMASAAARLWGGVQETSAADNEEFDDDEDTDEAGDLFEHISPTDYRSMAEFNAE